MDDIFSQLSGNSLHLLDVEFKAAIPAHSIQNKILKFIKERHPRDISLTGIFSCPFYYNTFIVKLYEIRPIIGFFRPPGSGNISFWITNGKEFLEFSPELKKLNNYNEVFKIKVTEKNIYQYAAFVSMMIQNKRLKLNKKVNLMKSESLYQLRRVGVELESLVNITGIPEGWKILSYLLTDPDRYVAETEFIILKNGSVPTKTLSVKVRPEKAFMVVGMR